MIFKNRLTAPPSSFKQLHCKLHPGLPWRFFSVSVLPVQYFIILYREAFCRRTLEIIQVIHHLLIFCIVHFICNLFTITSVINIGTLCAFILQHTKDCSTGFGISPNSSISLVLHIRKILSVSLQERSFIYPAWSHCRYSHLEYRRCHHLNTCLHFLFHRLSGL